MKARIFPLRIIRIILLCTLMAGVVGCGTTPQDSVRTTETTPFTSEISDSEILEAIKRAFQRDSNLANANISVTVQNQVVTLNGRVSNALVFNRAISLARSAVGFPLQVLATGLTY